MKKRFLSLLSSIILGIAPVFAYDFSAVAPSGQTLYYNISGTTATVTAPSNSYGSPWWSDYPRPTGSLTIPSSVAYGGQHYSVTCIGNRALSGCDGLTSVTIPNSVTNINNSAFLGCDSLTSVTIPNSVTSIGQSAFQECTALISVAIPNSVTYIGDWAFCECVNLTSVTIPNSVTSIGNRTFSICNSLTSVTIPNSVISIGQYAFSDCSSLTSVTIGNSVTTIGHWAFRNCSGLTSVIIPNPVTTIGDCAFEGCSSLTSVTIPNSVTTIGTYAFRYCSSLTPVTIPNSVTTIGNAAFSDVNTVIYCGNATGSPWGAHNAGCYYSEGDFIFTDDSKTTLVGYTGIGGGITIPNSVTTIGSYAFRYCSDLTSVIIPNSVTSIGESAFFGCSNLSYVTIPNSVTTIGSYAFRYCSGLTSVIIPNSVTTINDYTFEGCSSLTSVTIPNSVTTIGSYAFRYCSGLTSVTIGNSVTTIGDYSFDGCNGLTEITSRNTVAPSLGSNAFYQVNSDIPINIPCGSTFRYFSRWSYFYNFVEATGFSFSATSTDSIMGVVQVLTEPSCTSPSAVIFASAHNGFVFDRWSNGVTTNPYTLALVSDTSLTAYFVLNIHTLTATSANSSQGLVMGGGAYEDGDTAVIWAAPLSGYKFDHWNDNNNDNPRNVIVTSDLSFTAYFINADTIVVHDTTIVHDTTFVPYPVHDTTYISVHDTTIVHDTTFVPYPVHDTTYISVHDTTIVHDTTFVPYPVHDTTYISVHDTTIVHDTTYINVYIHDTTIVHDTIVQHPNYYELSVISDNPSRGVVAGNGRFPDSTLVEIAAIPIEGNRFIHWQDGNTDNPRSVQLLGGNANFVATFDSGTQSVYDVPSDNSVTISTDRGQIIVSNVSNKRIRLFDSVGRIISTSNTPEETRIFNMPATGVYLLQVDNFPAQRVVVVN